MTFLVRPASVDDDTALSAVDRATWTSRTSPTPPPDWSPPRPFFRDDRGPDGFLVAQVDHEAIGFVALHQPLDVPSHAHVLTIDGLRVLGGNAAARRSTSGAASWWRASCAGSSSSMASRWTTC